MKQINARTGYERDVLRVKVAMPAKASTSSSPEGGGATAGGATAVRTRMDIDDGAGTAGAAATLLDEDIPPFPVDLVDQQTGELKEPLLRAKVGQLIQIQCKRDDGWSYGFVIFDTTAAQSDDVPLVSALRDIEKRKAAANGTINDHNPVTTQQQGDGLVSGISGWWKDRRGQRQDPQNAAKNPLPLDDDKNGDDHDGEDDGGFASGWFPDAFTRNPSPLELAEMQASMLTVAGGEQEVVDVLAPPDHWDSKDNPDPLDAKIVELKADQEYNDVVDFFKASLGDSLKKLKSVKSVRRIESLSLWQSYVAKRRQLEIRAIAEGKDEAYAKAYEQKWMFHGT